jgi:hypothetical protein
MVETRVVPVKRKDRKKAASDHSKALSTGFRVNKNRASKNVPAAANISSAYPGKETVVAA